MKFPRLVLCAFALACAGAPAPVRAQLYWNTNGSSSTWTNANWGSSASGPFTTAWTSNSNVEFTADSSVTFATTSIGNVTVDAGRTVTIAQAGTLSMNGAVRTFDIGTGATLTWTSQTVTANSAAGITKNGAGTLNLGALTFTTNMNGGFTLNAGTVVVSGDKALGNGALTLNGGTLQSSGSRTFAVSSLTIGGDFAFAGTGNANWGTGGIGLGSTTRTITNNTTSGSRQLLGVISGGSGAGLTFSGTGAAQIYLGNTGNTFSGPVTISGGEVVFNDNGSLGASTSITIDGGRLTMATMDTSGNTSALTSATISSGKTIYVGATAGTSLSIQGGTGVTTFNGVIADKSGSTGAWAKQGAGTLVLGGASTYSGDTSINNGTVKLTTGGNRLPTGTTVSLGQAGSTNLGTLDLNGQDQQIAGLNSTTGTNSASTDNTVTSSTTATLTLGGSGTYSYGDGSNTNSGIITGSIALVKSGSGTQTLGDANTYTGGTSINGGTLAAASTGALGSSGSISFGGGTLKYSGVATDYSSRIAGSSGAIAVDTNGQSVTYGSSLAGSNTGGLTKAGSGTLTLSAANHYSGGTTVSAGTLSAGHNSALGSGAVTIGSGGILSAGAGIALDNDIAIGSGGTLNGASGSSFAGTISGDGSLDGAVTLASGGSLSPGNSPGNLTVTSGSSLTFTSGSTYDWQLGSLVANGSGSAATDWDLITLNGTASLSTNGVFLTPGFLTANSAPDQGDSFWSSSHSWTVVTGNASSTITGTFQVDNSGWSTGAFSTQLSGNDLVLNWTASAVPEPSTYAAILGAFALAGAAVRRRRQSRKSTAPPRA
ncbi:MAG TPA: autotransporter-associated beta strand repeat-containing protein [Opitutus sp.]|nr:autotransporter-associated beta strand repeat-containing protein [Opitutus sp.]